MRVICHPAQETTSTNPQQILTTNTNPILPLPYPYPPRRPSTPSKAVAGSRFGVGTRPSFVLYLPLDCNRRTNCIHHHLITVMLWARLKLLFLCEAGRVLLLLFRNLACAFSYGLCATVTRPKYLTSHLLKCCRVPPCLIDHCCIPNTLLKIYSSRRVLFHTWHVSGPCVCSSYLVLVQAKEDFIATKLRPADSRRKAIAGEKQPMYRLCGHVEV